MERLEICVIECKQKSAIKRLVGEVDYVYRADVRVSRVWRKSDIGANQRK